MQKAELRNASGKLIGWIETESSGKQTGRGATGSPLGYFDAKNNVTHDVRGKRIGTGNHLATLIGMAVTPSGH